MCSERSRYREWNFPGESSRGRRLVGKILRGVSNTARSEGELLVTECSPWWCDLGGGMRPSRVPRLGAGEVFLRKKCDEEPVPVE